jgi:hypothetical protein
MRTNYSKSVTERKKWIFACLLSFFYFIPAFLYISYAGISSSVLMVLSFITASTASLLFATTLSLGSISHFIGWPNMKLGYQKQIGVLAFWYSCFYCITLLVLYPEVYWHGFFSNFFSADILLGSTAMVIFTTMVLINSKVVSPHIPRETITFVLGLGYVGYALLVIRAILIELPVWSVWFETFSGPPPGRLVLSVIAFGVLILRLAVAVDKHLHPSLQSR